MWTWPRGLKKLGHIFEEAAVDCVVEYSESLEWDCPSSVLAKFCKQLRDFGLLQATLGSRRFEELLLSGDR